MKKFIYTIIGIVLLSLSSCSDFLEPKSQSEYVPKDANALQEMLIGSAYPQHKSGNNLLGFLSFLDDDVQFHKTGYEFDSNSLGYVESKKAVFTWQPDMFFIMEKNSPVVYNIWEGYYKFILGANAALDYIGDVNGTEAEKNYVIAQALGLRAFYYFMLVNHFGAPYNYDKQAAGVPLKLTSNLLPEEDLLMTRNSVEEVYNQIIEDLSEAERLFLTLSKDKQYEPNYLISLPMIQLLKSRVFLYMENWKDAAIYADKVINEWSFSLINLNNLPSTSTAEPYYNFTSLKSSEVIWLYGNVSDLTEFNNETVSREEEDPDYPGWGINITYYRKAFTASDDLLESFKDGDLRKEKYIAKEYNRINNSFYPDYYSSFGKYQLSAMGEPNGSENFALSFRLSEAYLNIAEAALTPTEGGIELRFKVPQGTNSWDDDISQIQKDFGVYLIYKDLQDEDFNRSWTGGASTNYKGEGCINDEMAKFYTEFMKKHVFSYLNNEKCKKVTSKLLPLYWYMAYNVHIATEIDLGAVVIKQNNAMHEIINGLDYWSTCLFGPQAEMTDKYIMPDDQVTFSQRRKMILGNIIKAAVEKRLITIPEEFNRGLDYVTPISFYFWETDSPDFHLNRGFPGTVNTNKFTLNEEYDGSNPTREATFAGYALLSLYYTEAESTERYSQFPLIIEKFAFVRKYMKENYGIDLEAIAKGPNDWDIQPHPEIPGNNDEDGGDDDDPWPGFDW